MKKSDMKAMASKMSDAELFSFFSGEKFYDNPELTKAVCQEIEIREAALANRKPAIVTFAELNCEGKSCGGRIIINEKYLKKNVKSSPGEVLNTILHEGRHEWQNWMIDHHPDRIPDSIKMMMAVDRTCYTAFGSSRNVIDVGISDKKAQAWIEYSMQEIEIDARFYAICRMKQVAEQYNLDETFLEAIDKAIDSEIVTFSLLCTKMDHKQYCLLEKLQAEKYREMTANNPKCPMLPEDYRCYGNIWMIQHVVYPAFIFLKTQSGKMTQLNPGKLFYDLYEEARMNMMKGTPLESSDQLVQIVMSDSDFKSEYRITDQEIKTDIKQTIGM